MTLGNYCGSLWRKKTIVPSTLHDTKFKRCLGLFDLIGLGIGSTVGIGVYVVTSYAITYEAGPSYVISVIIAGVASLFAGLCYAEFAARLPRCGSAYLYTYATLGELCAFVVGWNMLLENIMSATIAAKAWSSYLDFMLNGTVTSVLTDHMDWTGSSLIDDHPDILAFTIVIIITLVNVSGARITSTLNLILVFFALLIIMCFVCVGYFHVQHENWTNSPGFFAQGFSGVLSAAATLFFAFSSFEIITAAGEETRDPSRTVPSAIMYSVFISFVVYFCVSTATTLSLHYFPVNLGISLPEALQTLHIHGASSVIAVGGLIGLTASLIGSCFYLTRTLYAMSKDGILFKIFSKRISERTKTPIISVLTSGSLVSVLALVVRFDVLLEIVSIGTILAYTTVAVSVICLRYQAGTLGLYMEYEDPDDLNYVQCTDFSYADFHLDNSKWKSKSTNSLKSKQLPNGYANMYCERTSDSNGYINGVLTQSHNKVPFDEDISPSEINKDTTNVKARNDRTFQKMDSVISSTSTGSISGIFRIPSDVILEPNETSWRTAGIGLIIFVIASTILCVMSLYVDFLLHLDSWWILLIILIFTVILISATVLIIKQPQNRTKLYFRTPYLPFVPLLSILTNIFLLASLPATCWIRFIIWMVFGIIVYFGYSNRHSIERQCDEQEVVLYEITDESSSRIL